MPADQLRMAWLDRLNELVDRIADWAGELGWSTRRIEKQMDDSQIGPYTAPVLLLQDETTRLMLEPIARSAPGVDGIVDLYLMPAYDDIASLFCVNDEWRIHHVVAGGGNGTIDRVGDSQPLSRESFQKAVDEMRQHAAALS
jgi:hypothetical protein